MFKPEKLAKFKDCGVHMLDSSDDILPAALHYLGLDPNTKREADCQKAAELVTKVRPSVRKFHSSEYLNALATGEICFVVGWSGDIKQAQKRAAEAKSGVEIGYAIPKEGAQMWFDNLAIPKDARNVAEAHEFIDYPAAAGGGGEELEFHLLCQRQSGEPEIHRQGGAGGHDRLSGRGDDETALHHQAHERPAMTQWLMNRLWTRIKTGTVRRARGWVRMRAMSPHLMIVHDFDAFGPVCTSSGNGRRHCRSIRMLNWPLRSPLSALELTAGRRT